MLCHLPFLRCAICSFLNNYITGTADDKLQNAIEIVIFILNTSQTGKHRRFLDWINKSSLPAAGFFFPFLTKSFTIKEKTEKQKGGRILIAQEIKLRIHEESDLFLHLIPIGEYCQKMQFHI